MESLSSSLTHATATNLRVVHIISGDRWAGAEVQAFTLMSQLRKHTQLHAIIMNEGELARRCRSSGIETTVLDESKLSSLQLFITLRRRLAELQPDVIHTHRQKENVLGSVANLLTHRAKCLRTVHGAAEFSPNYRQKLQIWLDNLCGTYLQDAIIAVSSDLQQQLTRAFPSRKLRVISNGIDPDEVRAGIHTADFRQAAPEAIHLGLVGRLDAVKRIDIFLQTAAILRGEQPEIPWAFHVFGEGKLETELKQLAEQLQLRDAICFHGHRRDIRSCIAGLDLMLMPSDHEGLPMAALEALALGVPLVAHDTGGLRDLLKHHSDCLVADHSPSGYAKAVASVLRNKPQVGLQDAYSAGRNGAQILSLYREL